MVERDSSDALPKRSVFIQRPPMRFLAIATAIGAAVVMSPSPAASPATLRLAQTIPLPGVQGRIDHLAIDLPGERLFICALGNNTVEGDRSAEQYARTFHFWSWDTTRRGLYP